MPNQTFNVGAMNSGFQALANGLGRMGNDLEYGQGVAARNGVYNERAKAYQQQQLNDAQTFQQNQAMEGTIPGIFNMFMQQFSRRMPQENIPESFEPTGKAMPMPTIPTDRPRAEGLPVDQEGNPSYVPGVATDTPLPVFQYNPAQIIPLMTPQDLAPLVEASVRSGVYQNKIDGIPDGVNKVIASFLRLQNNEDAAMLANAITGGNPLPPNSRYTLAGAEKVAQDNFNRDMDRRAFEAKAKEAGIAATTQRMMDLQAKEAELKIMLENEKGARAVELADMKDKTTREIANLNAQLDYLRKYNGKGDGSTPKGTPQSANADAQMAGLVKQRIQEKFGKNDVDTDTEVSIRQEAMRIKRQYPSLTPDEAIQLSMEAHGDLRVENKDAWMKSNLIKATPKGNTDVTKLPQAGGQAQPPNGATAPQVAPSQPMPSRPPMTAPGTTPAAPAPAPAPQQQNPMIQRGLQVIEMIRNSPNMTQQQKEQDIAEAERRLQAMGWVKPNAKQ